MCERLTHPQLDLGSTSTIVSILCLESIYTNHVYSGDGDMEFGVVKYSLKKQTFAAREDHEYKVCIQDRSQTSLESMSVGFADGAP